MERVSMSMEENNFQTIPEDNAFVLQKVESDAVSHYEKKDTPLHEMVLKQYFGSAAAEDFLHPKLETIVKKAGHNTGRQDFFSRETTKASIASKTSDVASLWGLLRSDSELRLLRKDRRMARRLKEAYNAFARQCIARHEIPPKRVFSDDNDLDKLTKATEEGRLELINEKRRRIEFMFRQAHIHRDQFKILSFNNPLPNLTDRFGEEGLGRRYVPSWNRENVTVLEESQVDATGLNDVQAVPEAPCAVDKSFSKPIETVETNEAQPLHQTLWQRSQNTTPKLGDVAPISPFAGFDYDLVNRQYSPASYRQHNYIFLTEKDCQSEAGRFTQRYEQEYGKSNRDPLEMMVRKEEIARRGGRRALREGVSLSAMLPKPVFINPVCEKLPEINKSTNKSNHFVSHSAPGTQRESSLALKKAKRVQWPALNLNSLLEYKDSLDSVFQQLDIDASKDNLRFGKAPVWQVRQ